MPHVLVIDDDPGFREAITAVVDSQGFTVDSVSTMQDARRALGGTPPDLILLDLKLPDGAGLDLLHEVTETDTDVVLITGNATVDSAVQALRQGATDYLVKPVDLERLRKLLAGVAHRCDLREEVQTLRGELRGLGRFGPIVGASPPMQEVYDAISRVAPTNASVLIQGESGTGKELVAQAIHELSRRRKKPFVAVNCGAISSQLIESELFGHERGSFTGAERTHRGYFERAAGGTLLLDEITEMPAELQVRLLRVLETGKVTRVGAEEETAVDVRIVAATNRDPQAAVREGKLREDLLYRLAVFPIRLPPLRERGDDIRLIAESFLAERNAAEENAGTRKQFTRAAVQALLDHDWPGNVRELKNAVERSYILATDQIDLNCLPFLAESSAVATQQQQQPINGDDDAPALAMRPGMSISEAERRLILATLEACDGNKEKAAGMLSISVKTLYNRLNAYKKQDPSG
jgi:DNA-binding NtrC family response regulator